MKAKTRQSHESERNVGLSGVSSSAINPRLNAYAMKTPSTAPLTAKIRLSANSCRTTLHREAPIASRTAISGSRTVARASNKFARFAQAINRDKSGDRQKHVQGPFRTFSNIGNAIVGILGNQLVGEISLRQIGLVVLRQSHSHEGGRKGVRYALALATVQPGFKSPHDRKPPGGSARYAALWSSAIKRSAQSGIATS